MKLLRSILTAQTPALRSFSRTYAVKPSVPLISEIRKKTEISITKAKEALIATENNLEKALAWIEEDLAKSGAKKAAKLADRVAAEGLIGVITRNDIPGSSNGALVELCCESDFVTRNKIFQQLVRDIAAAALNIPENALEVKSGVATIPAAILNEAKLIETNVSVKDAISETVSKLGENIQLRRAITTRFPSSESASVYTAASVHGGEADCGKIGGLVVLHVENGDVTEPGLQLARQLSRHVVGLDPLCLDSSDAIAKEKQSSLSAPEYQDFLTSSVLLNQEFLFGQGSVQERLDEFKKNHGSSLSIKSFTRLVAGEGVDKGLPTDFHSEVMKQIEKSLN
ncbi:Elongation factor Ts, mitochondrial [Entomophthora muscae]|uniref:Elongation factor Ts, mitochondrial n=1 Tax=Entomophthora muscae TaxID=34485 RepID=A0ACC2UPE2_9FUNG|nr:Elongation factor Ts, mitochondrial [Entomophthora muscae]